MKGAAVLTHLNVEMFCIVSCDFVFAQQNKNEATTDFGE